MKSHGGLLTNTHLKVFLKNNIIHLILCIRLKWWYNIGKRITRLLSTASKRKLDNIASIVQHSPFHCVISGLKKLVLSSLLTNCSKKNVWSFNNLTYELLNMIYYITHQTAYICTYIIFVYYIPCTFMWRSLIKTMPAA